MRYAAPVAMPTGLGEWLGAELEARGVEAASLYARAVLSILLHSEVAEVEAELDHPERDPNAWNPRAALELELRLERHTKETRRGRSSIKKNYSPKSGGGNQTKRSSNMATPGGKNHGTTLLRRRPHSWNGGDEEALKKCAAIECLLSATDDGQWGPVEKLVDELCTRLKLLQLEQQSCRGDTQSNKYRRTGDVGGSAPEHITNQRAAIHSPSESDSFTSVSSPEAGSEDYSQAFPPLEYFSDSDQGNLPTNESIWDVRKNTENESQKNRVRFVRMTGTRLSPPLSIPTLPTAHSYGDSCPSETYFGDCSRDSSLERPCIGIEAAVTAVEKNITTAKGRLYERGSDFSSGEFVSVNVALESAFKSLRQFQDEPFEDPNEESVVAGELPVLSNDIGRTNWNSGWGRNAMNDSDGSCANIWAPLESDWALLGPDTMLIPWSTDSFAAKIPTDAAVQLSLALLNHHPEKSGFSPVLAKSLMLHTSKESLPKNSKLMEWLANLAANGAEQKQQVSSIVDGADEEEIEYILKEPPAEVVAEHHLVVDEDENLLTSPKTHFCPIQQEGDAEVQVSDGATFDVDAQPDEVHFLRSPSGALYLPDCEENGDGWKGWAKYMIYKSPPSPSPLLALEADSSAAGQQFQSGRATSPFTLKFRVVQTEKYCQTDSKLSIDHSKLSAGPLAISEPFVASFSTATDNDVLGKRDVWKFDAKAITLEAVDESRDVVEEHQEVKNAVIEELDAKEEELDGLLSEVWSTAAALRIASDEDDDELRAEEPLIDKLDGFCGSLTVAEVPSTALTEVDEATIATSASQNEVEEFDLDELWNPFMDETGEEQVDVCEWVPQAYCPSGHENHGDQWTEDDTLAIAESWPPPNIPVEYFDDEFFEEIYGSLDSMKMSETASTGGGGGGSKNSRRRRRRSSKNQPLVRRPKRPCSFFVEGECRRPDCKFSHDLGSITCRFWIESSCFKGDECPFLHGIAAKENGRSRNCSDAELSESYGSGEELLTPHCFRERGGKVAKKFQFDLEADFPSLSQAPSKSGSIAISVGSSRSGPIVSQSRPIAITQGFAAADHTGSSLENTGPAENGGLKRRRKRFCTRPVCINLVETTSETSPVETVSFMGKRSRKLAKITLGVQGVALSTKRDKKKITTDNVLVQSSERRRTKSEHDCCSVAGGSSRSRLSSSYKEG